MRTQQQMKILDVAERLILQRGLTLTSVQDICQAMKISKGTLYYHYASKNAIIDDLAERYFQKTDEALNKFIGVLEEEPVEVLLYQCMEVVRLKKTTEKLHYMLMTYGVIAYPELKTKFQVRYNNWIKTINLALEFYRPNNKHNLMLSHIILAVFDGLAIKNVIDMPSVFDDKTETLEFINSIIKIER